MSAGKSANQKSTRRQSVFRSSPKTDAIIQRLRYVGDYVFGGDIEAYGAAVGFSKEWMLRILNSTTRVRLSTFIKFVESGVVSAEWLFCGVGRMCNTVETIEDTMFGRMPRVLSKYRLFDTTLIPPDAFSDVVACSPTFSAEDINFLECHALENKENYSAVELLAEEMYTVNSSGGQIFLYVSAQVICDGRGVPVLIEFMQQKKVNAIILPMAAVELDTKKTHIELAEHLMCGAKVGAGLGESFAFGCTEPNSILAQASKLDIPCFVHMTIGGSPLHFVPTHDALEFGRIIGGAAHVDLMALADLFMHAAITSSAALPTPKGIFMVAGATTRSTEVFYNNINHAVAIAVATKNQKLVDDMKIGHRIAYRDICKLTDTTSEADAWKPLFQLRAACREIYGGKK